MDKTYVLFTANKSIYSKAIRWFTWDTVSHVDIFDPSRKVLIGATPSHGVAELDYIEVIAKASYIAMYEIEFPSENVIASARTQLGKKYDYSGIAGFLFRRNWENPVKWFCSEFIPWAFEAAGLILFKMKPHKISPRDLHIHPSFKLVFEYTN